LRAKGIDKETLWTITEQLRTERDEAEVAAARMFYMGGNKITPTEFSDQLSDGSKRRVTLLTPDGRLDRAAILRDARRQFLTMCGTVTTGVNAFDIRGHGRRPRRTATRPPAPWRS
jgi:hypothetical protein